MLSGAIHLAIHVDRQFRGHRGGRSPGCGGLRRDGGAAYTIQKDGRLLEVTHLQLCLDSLPGTAHRKPRDLDPAHRRNDDVTLLAHRISAIERVILFNEQFKSISGLHAPSDCRPGRRRTRLLHDGHGRRNEGWRIT